MKYLLPFFVLLLAACGADSDVRESDEEQIRDEVRNYLFLGDSVEVAVAVTDTILVEELDGMLATIEDNLMKIQLDIDTLGLIIDDVAYDNLEKDQEIHAMLPEKVIQLSAERELVLLQHQIKLRDLNTQKLGFQQTKRVMLHLRRAQLNSIAGYQVSATYEFDEQAVELAFLMTADFKIVD